MIRRTATVLLFFCVAVHAAEVNPPVKKEMVKCLDSFNKLGKAEKQCPSIESQSQSNGDWISIPASDAQCTAGARSAGHYAKVKISTFDKDTNLSVETLASPKAGAVQEAIKSHPLAKYVGNGPIYMEGNNSPNGYVKSSGKVISAIDCVNFRTNSGNLGRENSIFLKYRPRTSSGDIATNGEWKYRVVSTSFLCNQLQPQPYVNWLQTQLPAGSDVQAELKQKKQWEPQEDLVSAGQIDFATRSKFA